MSGQETETVGKIIIISDTHFGDKAQLLNDASLVDVLTGVISERGKVSELILLGDIADLWMKPLAVTFRSAKYFINSISVLANIEKITYLPGNHDHQLFMDEFRKEMDMNIKKGDLSTPKFMPVRAYPGTTLSYLQADPDTPFSMVYPFIVRHANGKEVLLTHGHHLDYFDNAFWWARTFWLSRYIIRKRKKDRKKSTLHDIEKANLPFYGLMSLSPWVPELVKSELRFYGILNFFNRLFRGRQVRLSPRRDTLIKDNYDEIAALLPLLDHPAPGCLVFGHTHRPGIGKLPGTGMTVVNSGSWVKQDNPDVPNMTWVEIEHDAKLYRLTDNKAELMYSESI